MFFSILKNIFHDILNIRQFGSVVWKYFASDTRTQPILTPTMFDGLGPLMTHGMHEEKHSQADAVPRKTKKMWLYAAVNCSLPSFSV